jgi:hypothetical protein
LAGLVDLFLYLKSDLIYYSYIFKYFKDIALNPNTNLGEFLVLAGYVIAFLAGYAVRSIISWRRRNRFR